MGTSHQQGFFHPGKKISALDQSDFGRAKKSYADQLLLSNLGKPMGYCEKTKGSVLLQSVKSEEKNISHCGVVFY